MAAYYKLYLLFIMLIIWRVSMCFSENIFSLKDVCTVQNNFDHSCFEAVRKVRSRLECLALCGQHSVCLGVIIDRANSSCYQQNQCVFQSNCSPVATHLWYYAKGSSSATPARSSGAVPTTSSSVTAASAARTNGNLQAASQTTSTTATSTTSTGTTAIATTANPASSLSTSTISATAASATTTAASSKTITILTTYPSATITASATTSTTTTTVSIPPSADWTIETSSTSDTTIAATTTTDTPGCQNNGVENKTTGECNCSLTGGWVGDFCERYPRSCRELTMAHYSAGTHRVWIDLYQDTTRLIDTRCIIAPSSSFTDIGVLNSTGKYNNNKSWSDYDHGFSHDEFNYWLGLVNIHRYNKVGYNNIGIKIYFYSASYKGWAVESYDGFVIANSSGEYRYTVGTRSKQKITSGSSTVNFDLEDVFGRGEGVQFSTYDRDQDGNQRENCAAEAGSGWWFSDCSPRPECNPLGWSYLFSPGNDSADRIRIPGVNMSSTAVQETFKYVHIFLRRYEFSLS